MRLDRSGAAATNALTALNQTATSLCEILNWRAANQPERLAYVYLLDGEAGEVRLTYAELAAGAARLANQLARVARPGDRALLLYPTGPEFLQAFLACMSAGLVAIPLFPPRPNRTLHRLETIIADSGVRLALATSRTLTDLEGQWRDHPQLAAVQRLATDTTSDASQPATLDRLPAPSDLAFLQYTSGSTQAPKGVMVTHGNLIYNCAYMRESFALSSESIAVTWLPHFHDMGLIEGLLNPIFVGYPTVVLSPANFVQRPLIWLTAISRFRATRSGAPNFAYDLCARKITREQVAELDLCSWDQAYTGAEPVRSETLDRFAEHFAPAGFRREALYPCYGLAEATLMVSGGDFLAGPTVLDCQADALEQGRVEPIERIGVKSRRLVACGYGRRDLAIEIVNPQSLRRTAPNEVGEIWVGGPTRAAGYWQRPDESAATFAARLADDPAAGPFLRTGDLGVTSGGQLYITGRLKDLIIVRGGNFYPQDLEWTAEQAHAALRPGFGAAFSVDVEGEERLVVAYELDRQFRKSSVAELQTIAAAVRLTISQEFDLDTYCVTLLNVGAVPKTSSGKIQRQACRADFLAGSLDVLWESRLHPAAAAANGNHHLPSIGDLAAQRPGDRRRTLIAWLRKEVAGALDINLADVTAHQPLGAQGLDSLKGNELTDRLRKSLLLELSPTLVWNYPTVAQMADHLAERMGLDTATPPKLDHANGSGHAAAHPHHPSAARRAPSTASARG
jgi:acyl-CoA synthetase (AMP-forming)/AMP-acid ligase II/acyl carrier protein